MRPWTGDESGDVMLFFQDEPEGLDQGEQEEEDGQGQETCGTGPMQCGEQGNTFFQEITGFQGDE